MEPPRETSAMPDVQTTINQILARVNTGELSGSQGAALIEIAKKRALRLTADARAIPPGRAHWLKVRVRADGHRFSIPIPLFLLNLGLRIGGRYIPADSGVSPAMIRDAVRLVAAQKVGKMIEVHDGDSHVEVWLY